MASETRTAKDIFVELINSVPSDQWDNRLPDYCHGNDALRNRVQALLRAHLEPGSFLDQPAAGAAVSDPDSDGLDRLGTTIGAYKLLQKIGEGGMGSVYMAEQLEPVERKVALKIIKPGMDSRRVIARFEAERQALALMDHPHIARVLDAGATDTGRPYFVMELVKGISIIHYCDEHRLTPRKRLELFIQVCQAVQHAHQKGIIHRDLKPTNILVADYDERPAVKIIDFGVAKAVGQRLTEKTMFTEFGQVIGTIEYMSPEQAKLNQLDIDTRTDIYSLGVLLYELLSGETPFDRERLRTAAFDETLRIIREEEPLAPSTRLSASHSLASIAANRQFEPKKLAALVRGDLDWIVLRALEKDRTRRYETAAGLADDIQRFLADQPVEARQPTRIYRAKKFIRRNRTAVVAGVAIAAALVVGLIFASVGLIQSRHQAEIARTQSARSEQVAQFLKDMLKGVAPSAAMGRDTTMLREVVDQTADRIDKDLKDQPEVQIELGLTLGKVYFDLQLYKKMEDTARHTLQLARAQYGEENVAVADALGQLGRALMFLRKSDEAETVTRQAIKMQQRVRGPGSPQEADSLVNLADVLRHGSFPASDLAKRMVEAETAVRTALAIRTKAFGHDSDDTAWANHALALVLFCQQRVDEAEAAIREAQAIRLRIHGEDHPYTAADRNLLGGVLRQEGKLDEAEKCYTTSLATMERLDGKGKLAQADVHFALGQVLRQRGKLDEAEAQYREAIAIGTREVGEDYLDLPTILAWLAVVLSDQGKMTEAHESAQHAVDICQRHPDQIEYDKKENANKALRYVNKTIAAGAEDEKSKRVTPEEPQKLEHAE